MLHILATCKYNFSRLQIAYRNHARLHSFTHIPSLYFIRCLQRFQKSYAALPKWVWMKNDHLGDHPGKYEASRIETSISTEDLLKSTARRVAKVNT